MLALTATPGCKASYILLLYHYKSPCFFLFPVKFTVFTPLLKFSAKKHTIQNVIDNLHISILEYRNESDNDVKKYMHDRQLELIEVAMSNDAVKINNLLLEAIQPFVSRLCGFGVLQHRDLSTEKYGEAEGYFGVLINLYYIRKLLSSHGTRPAYEMLQEKMQQGYADLYCFIVAFFQ
ncbi:unnamed protein product [Victoria cruziana]